ncbi:MAG TPA: 50S ribosomal protein L17 [Bacteroidia bacterium]|jgi:large subunit ribosomal protein L17|nr:50S ribosomal protein L17 [Bacteroidia bacterium]
MRHLNKHNHLGRTASHRKALLANMSCSLILHKKINTTVAKAKALKIYVEPIITTSKEDTTHARRMAFSYLGDKESVKELFRVVAPKIATRPGGYTRILKTGARPGDNSQMCLLELVDFNTTMEGGAEKATDAKAKGTTRRGRKKGGAGAEKATKAAEATA